MTELVPWKKKIEKRKLVELLLPINLHLLKKTVRRWSEALFLLIFKKFQHCKGYNQLTFLPTEHIITLWCNRSPRTCLPSFCISKIPSAYRVSKFKAKTAWRNLRFFLHPASWANQLREKGWINYVNELEYVSEMSFGRRVCCVTPKRKVG